MLIFGYIEWSKHDITKEFSVSTSRIWDQFLLVSFEFPSNIDTSLYYKPIPQLILNMWGNSCHPASLLWFVNMDYPLIRLLKCRITPSCCGCVWYGTVRHIRHYETTDSSGIQRKRPTSISNKKPLQVNLPILPKASRASRSQAPIPCWKILKKSSIYY